MGVRDAPAPVAAQVVQRARMKILGISAWYHDAAACVVRDGEIVAAAQEERFTRRKHDPEFPANAVRSCLEIAGLSADELDAVIDDINATGYGLTVGIHSRIDGSVEHIVDRINVGNAYVNRNQIGAVVGVQPFGGEGLSGTGPKAGGPRYLHRFATERSLCVNTTAQGGNTSLMSLDES